MTVSWVSAGFLSKIQALHLCRDQVTSSQRHYYLHQERFDFREINVGDMLSLLYHHDSFNFQELQIQSDTPVFV